MAFGEDVQSLVGGTTPPEIGVTLTLIRAIDQEIEASEEPALRVPPLTKVLDPEPAVGHHGEIAAFTEQFDEVRQRLGLGERLAAAERHAIEVIEAQDPFRKAAHRDEFAARLGQVLRGDASRTTKRAPLDPCDGPDSGTKDGAARRELGETEERSRGGHAASSRPPALSAGSHQSEGRVAPAASR